MDSKLISYLTRSSWLEIDLDAITNNIQQLRKLVGPDIKIMPAVKANGYGLGLVKVCKTLIEAGADILACGCLDDGIELRESGIDAPVFTFASNTITEVADIYLRYNIMPTILEIDQAKFLSGKASETMNIFTKIETGRGRIGVPSEDALSFFQQLSKIPKIKIMGVYSHLAGADWPDKKSPEYTEWQIDRFKSVWEGAKKIGLDIPIWQIANTTGSICFPHARFTGCCIGRLPGGHRTLEIRDGYPDLLPALKAWKSRIIQIKTVTGGKFGPNDESIKLQSPATLGVIPTGVHDGLMFEQKKGEVLVRGKRVRVWSPISLEHITIDLSNCPEAQSGDEVVIVGKQGEEEITLDEITKLWKMPLTHFLGHLNPDLARIYFRNGEPVGINLRSGYKDL